MSRLFALIGVLFVIFPSPAVAQTDTKSGVAILSPKETLRRLQTVTVAVDGVDELKAFLPADTLKTAIELKLRQNGLTVKQTADDKGMATFLPTVGLEGNILKLDRADSYVYNLRLVLVRFVELNGIDNTKMTFATAMTWKQEIVGIVPASDVDRVIRQATDDLVARFLNDYLEQNPKR